MYRSMRIGLMTLAMGGLTTASNIHSADPIDPRRDELTVAEMMGPVTDASTLFSKLKVDHDYRQFPGRMLDSVRNGSTTNGEWAPWPGEAYVWANPSFGHKPLYFEQTNLERYGWKSPRCVHPTLSAVHFYGSIGLLPVSWLRYPPHRCVSTAGHYRPGTCF